MLTIEHVVVVLLVGIRRRIIVFNHSYVIILQRLTDNTFLTATKDLEHIAFLQIDGGMSPNLRVLTIATGKQVQGRTEYIHTLLVEDDARTTLQDFIVFMAIKGSLALGILCHRIKHAILTIAVNQGTLDIDDHVAIDMTTLIASAIDVTTLEAALQVGIFGVIVLTFRYRRNVG